MLRRLLTKGATSQIFHVFLEDRNYSDGRGFTGLLFSNGNLKFYYMRSGATASTAVTPADITTLGTFNSGGFKQVDSTNMPGLYEVHVPNAAFATGSNQVNIMISDGNNSIVPVIISIELTDFDLFSASVTVGTNNDKTGYTVSTVQDKTGYTVSTVNDKTGYSLSQAFPTNFAALAITASTGQVTVGTNNDKTGYTVSTVGDKTGYALTSGEETNIANKVWDTARGSHTTAGTFGEGVTSVQGNVTGSVASVTGAVGSVTGAVGSVTGNIGGNIIGSVASVTNGVTLHASAIQAIWDAATSALVTAGSIGKKLASWVLGTDNKVLLSADTHTSGVTVTAVSGAVGSVTAGVVVTTNNDKTGYALTSGEHTSIAQSVLVTPVSGVEGSLSGNCLGKSVALVLNKSSFNDSTNIITIRNTGDSADLFTIPGIVQAVVDPITGKGQAS